MYTESSDGAQPLCGAARPQSVDRSLGPPCPCTQLTTQITPEVSWSPGNYTRGLAPAVENISVAFHRFVYNSASRQALLSRHEDNAYITNNSLATSLIENDTQSHEAPIQPSWIVSSVPYVPPNSHGLPRCYLDGIGAWQAGPIPGFINTPSSAVPGEHADDRMPRVYYPELPNV